MMLKHKMMRPQNKIELPENINKDHIKNPAMNYAVGRNFAFQQSGDVTEITIYDVIGDYWGEGVSAQRFNETLNAVKTNKILLKINSPGGDVFDGIAIYNDLKAHSADITVRITGLAASAASIIAMAGDTVEIAETAQIMIHNAWVIAVGNKHDFREVADVLDGIDQGLIAAYVRRTGLDEKEISDLLDKETWMRGQQAIDKGFADALLEENENAKAAYDVSMFAQAPVALKRDIEGTLCEAGYSRAVSKAAVSKGFQVLDQREADKDIILRAQREAAGELTDLKGSMEEFLSTLKAAI